MTNETFCKNAQKTNRYNSIIISFNPYTCICICKKHNTSIVKIVDAWPPWGHFQTIDCGKWQKAIIGITIIAVVNEKNNSNLILISNCIFKGPKQRHFVDKCISVTENVCIYIHLYIKLPSTTAEQAAIIYLHQWWLIILNHICINKLLWFGKAYQSCMIRSMVGRALLAGYSWYNVCVTWQSCVIIIELKAYREKHEHYFYQKKLIKGSIHQSFYHPRTPRQIVIHSNADSLVLP